MPLRSRVIDAMKACLRARGMTYGALAGQLGVSEPTVKRMFSRGTFTLARIEQILEVIDLDLQELARLAREGSGRPGELSTEQEAALAQDERRTTGHSTRSSPHSAFRAPSSPASTHAWHG
jgi:AraC-like DNA-binding protein